MPSVLFLGAESRFSAAALSGLVEQGARVLAVVLIRKTGRALTPVPPGQIALHQPDPLDEAIRGLGLPPAITIDKTHDLAGIVERFPAQVGVCACFPRRVPGHVLCRFREGVLNLHPSKLPAYRGPAPLFWQLRDGLDRTAVTVHRMVPALDAGPVVAREAMAIPLGASVSWLEGELGRLGGSLVGRLPWSQVGEGRAQDEAQASYQTWPTPLDYCISPQWSAERTFRFMRGTASVGLPYPIEIAGKRLSLEQAIDFRPDRQLAEPVELDGREVRVNMRPGVLIARRSRHG